MPSCVLARRGGISRIMLNAPSLRKENYDAPIRTQIGVSMKRFVVLTFIFLCTVLSAAYAKETGSTRMDVDLMTKPYSDAKAAGKLPQSTAVSVLERSGGWLRISAGGKSGWVKLHQVRLGEGTQAKKSGGGLAVLKSVVQTPFRFDRHCRHDRHTWSQRRRAESCQTESPSRGGHGSQPS